MENGLLQGLGMAGWGLEGQIASMGCALSVSLLHRASLKGGPHNYNKSKQALGGSHSLSFNWVGHVIPYFVFNCFSRGKE